ncbi:hypothetical protein ACWGE1_09415 [Streptomyces sp. NPDC054932]
MRPRTGSAALRFKAAGRGRREGTESNAGREPSRHPPVCSAAAAAVYWGDRHPGEGSAAPATLITSRKPDDLDAFCTTLVKEFTLAAQA